MYVPAPSAMPGNATARLKVRYVVSAPSDSPDVRPPIATRLTTARPMAAHILRCTIRSPSFRVHWNTRSVQRQRLKTASQELRRSIVNDKDSRDSRDCRDFRVSVDIDAPPARVWSVMSDVERWSNWIEPTAQGSRVTLSVGIRGLFAGLLARLTGEQTAYRSEEHK